METAMGLAILLGAWIGGVVAIVLGVVALSWATAKNPIPLMAGAKGKADVKHADKPAVVATPVIPALAAFITLLIHGGVMGGVILLCKLLAKAPQIPPPGAH